MQKNSTSLKKTDLIPKEKTFEMDTKLQPNVNSLQKILQFASSYRTQKVAENQFVEWFLN
jgi:hypothetical protein